MNLFGSTKYQSDLINCPRTDRTDTLNYFFNLIYLINFSIDNGQHPQGTDRPRVHRGIKFVCTDLKMLYIIMLKFSTLACMKCTQVRLLHYL